MARDPSRRCSSRLSITFALLLLGSRPAWSIDSLLNLSSQSILACIELLADSSILREWSANRFTYLPYSSIGYNTSDVDMPITLH